MAEKTNREYDEVSKEKNGDWQHLVEHCISQYEDNKKSEYREKKLAEIKESRRIYEQHEETTNFPWPKASNIDLPLTTISVDNLEPRFAAGLVGKKPYINYVTEGGQKVKGDLEILQAWWNEELENGIKIDRFARDMTHDLLLEGTVYPIPSYDLEEVERMDFQFDQQGMVVKENEIPVIVETKEKIFEGGKVDLVPFSDIFIADNIDDWEKATVIRKVYPTYAELMRDKDEKKGYINIGTWLCKEQGDMKLKEDQQTPSQEIDSVEVTGKEVIECIECSLSYVYQEENQEEKDIKNWKEERIIAQIALDKKILIRLVKLRDINFRNEHLVKRIRLFPEKGKSYGTSVYGKMRSIQKGASRTFNLVINSAHVEMIPWFFYAQEIGLKGDITIYPGKGVPVEGSLKDGVLFPKFNTNPNQFVEFIYVWVSFWERLLSIGDLQVGRKGDKDTTATETLAVIQEGNVKHNYQSEQFKEEFLSVIRTLYDLYYQYMPFDKTFTWNDQKVQIPRREMGRQRTFRLTGSTEMMNKMIERKQNEDFYKLSLADPNKVFNPIAVAKDLVKSYGKDEPDEYINPFLNKLSMILQELPQIEPAIEEVIQQVIQTAQQTQQRAEAEVNVA